MFSKACKYAIRAVLYLATHSNETKKFGVKDVAEVLDVPKAYLAKLLQQLAKEGIIASSKGSNGGFYLADGHREAHLRDIIECIDGAAALKDCVLGLSVCSSDNPCALHHDVLKFRQNLDRTLSQRTVANVTSSIKKKKLKI